MQSLQARIDSFQKTKRVKRNPAVKSSQAASIKWPHPSHFKANPNTLAEAGFFFNPSWHDRDSVTCFLCGKEISDWNEDDDPFEIHYSKCQSSCPWAFVRCGLTEDLDDGVFVFKNKIRIPSVKAMEKARLETFGQDWWPHDQDPTHGATSVKMARAGFIYTPQAAGDDTAMCLYCNLSLSGWEKEDDPVEEHRSRDTKLGTSCPFLALSSKPTRSKPVKKPPVEKPETHSEDELGTVQVENPPPRAKRGKARSTTSTTSSKSRRKTRATRGKSAKTSAPPRRSPSPSQTVPREQDEAAPPDVPMDVDAPSHSAPEHDPISEQPPLSSDSLPDDDPAHVNVNGSTRSLSDRPESPPAPSPPTKPDTPPPDAALNHPSPVVSLSPAGQPTITQSKLLTPDERSMSLEQWIRQEIDIGYEKLMTDGQRQIDLFKTRAAELRTCIEQL